MKKSTRSRLTQKKLNQKKFFDTVKFETDEKIDVEELKMDAQEKSLYLDNSFVPVNEPSISEYKPSEVIDPILPKQMDALNTPLSGSSIISPTVDKDPLSSYLETSSEAEEDLQIWVERERRVTFSIVTRLVRDKEHIMALQLLQPVLEKSQNDPYILSCVGRLLLQMGNVKAAAAIFEKAESLTPNTSASALVLMNRGFLAFSKDEYTKAIEGFGSVLSIDPTNIQAANNRALCWLYTCNLTMAIKSLEELIFKDPETFLQETLVFNLCTLYDLASEKSIEKKKTLLSLITKYGVDNFDVSFCKLQESGQ